MVPDNILRKNINIYFILRYTHDHKCIECGRIYK